MEVFILGSGESINNLTDEEIDYINQSEITIAQNKFTAFMDKARIEPSHVFFIDYHSKTSKFYLQYIINLIEKKGLTNTNFLFNHKIKSRIFESKNLIYKLQKYNPTNYIHYKKPRLLFNFKPEIEFIKVAPYLKGGEWANDLNQKLFHYRSSLTTIFNYISIKFPGATIKLVGVDLNASDYFYEQEMEQLNKKHKDWTTEYTKNKGIHFTLQDFKGTNMFDKFDLLLEGLKASNNKVISCNKKSYFVQNNLFEYGPIID